MKRVCCTDIPLVVAVLMVAGLLMVSREMQVAEAACNPTELAPCLPVLTAQADPTELCCYNLRNQKPCLCGYLRDPSYSGLVHDPRVVEKFSRVCGVSVPRCF